MNKITLVFLTLTGEKVETASISFSKNINILYGASNTGKSFILKAIDFMFGAKELKMKIPELSGYDKVYIGFKLGDKSYTLERSIKGGDFNIYNELIEPSHNKSYISESLSVNSNNTKSLSNFFLEYLSFNNKNLAKNSNGETQKLSFRNISDLILTDEINIQSEKSPILTGQHISATFEKSLFRFLLSGLDDSEIISVIDNKTFKTMKESRVNVYKELITELDDQLDSYENENELNEQLIKINQNIENSLVETKRLREEINPFLEEKRKLINEVSRLDNLISDTNIHINRFETLSQIYRSDIERLVFIEEAGYLSLLGQKKECFECGSSIPEDLFLSNQQQIQNEQISAIAEIQKIELLQNDLALSIKELRADLEATCFEHHKINNELENLEKHIDRLTISIDIKQGLTKELNNKRDTVRDSLRKHSQRKVYINKITETNAIKKPKNSEKPNLKIPSSNLHEFCGFVSDVLDQWSFPGQHHISFDESSFDIIIDGKNRIYNGKGVRALTHAAFKVALLLYCKEKGLPHPSLIVLDTPLLAYRDPIKHKAGSLTNDEKNLLTYSVKEAFFKHLLSITHLCQFIILENIDPPSNLVDERINLIQFSGSDEQGRKGFFPNN